MDCHCGDPSCGYCQAARIPQSNYHYPFEEHEEYVPMDPFDGHLRTIYEVDETKASAEEGEYDDGEEEEEEYEQNYENLEVGNIKDIGHFGLGSEGISDIQINELQVSEDEKKRLRNTEAARRCREKIKRKTEDLEEELTSLTTRNELMNQHRIRLLSQVEEQMRMLDMMKKRNPSLSSSISYEAKKIVDTYTEQVEGKRKAIRDYFDTTCTKSY